MQSKAKLSSMSGFKALDIDNPEYAQIREQQNEQGKEICKLFHRIFVQSEDGQKLLELFEKRFLMIPVCPPGSGEGYGYFREGQNDVVRQILQNCEQAEKLNE